MDRREALRSFLGLGASAGVGVDFRQFSQGLSGEREMTLERIMDRLDYLLAFIRVVARNSIDTSVFIARQSEMRISHDDYWSVISHATEMVKDGEVDPQAPDFWRVVSEDLLEEQPVTPTPQSTPEPPDPAPSINPAV